MIITISADRVRELIQLLKRNQELDTGYEYLEAETGYGFIIKNMTPQFGEINKLLDNREHIAFLDHMKLRVELVTGNLAVFLFQNFVSLTIDYSKMIEGAKPIFEYHPSSESENYVSIRRYLTVDDYSDNDSLIKMIQKMIEECKRVYQEYHKEPEPAIIPSVLGA